MTINLFKIGLISGISIAFLSGCVNQDSLSNPNTQTGAAVGAVTGAVVGANVGEKSGRTIAAGAVLGALAGGAIGEATTEEKPAQTGGWQ